MFAAETVLCGSVVTSVQPAAPSSASPAAATARIALVVMGPSSRRVRRMSEPHRDAGGVRARAGIAAVVDAVQPDERVHAAVAGDGEGVLDRREDAHLLHAR